MVYACSAPIISAGRAKRFSRSTQIPVPRRSCRPRIADGYATWAVLIAPHLTAAEHPLVKWDVARGYFAQEATVREALVPLYFCPARVRTSGLSSAGDIDPVTGQHVAGAVGDYAGVAGAGDPAHPWDGPDADGAIILGEVLERRGDRIVRWRGRTSLSAIRDARGQSVTLLVGEKHVPRDEMGRADAGDGSLYDGRRPRAVRASAVRASAWRLP